MAADPNYMPEQSGGGCSGCFKSLGCGCFLMLLLCCGGGLTLVWRYGESVSKEPAEVAQVGNQIAQFDFPPGFDPKFSIDLRLPLMGEIGKAAIYTAGQDSLIMLAEMKDWMSGMSPDQIRLQIRAVGPEQDLDRRQLEVVHVVGERMMIRGHSSLVAFAELEDAQTKQQFWQVTVPFSGREGPAFLMMVLPRDKYDEAEVKRLVTSIK